MSLEPHMVLGIQVRLETKGAAKVKVCPIFNIGGEIGRPHISWYHLPSFCWFFLLKQKNKKTKKLRKMNDYGTQESFIMFLTDEIS